MTLLLNPARKASAQLGFTDEAWLAIKANVQAYLDSKADSPTVTEVLVRAEDPALSDPRVWAQICAEMNLIPMPGP